MKIAHWDQGLRFDDPNLKWGDPSVLLEAGDPGFVAPEPPPTPTPNPKTKGRKYMASNATPDNLSELIAAGEDLCDGLVNDEVALNILTNTSVKTRADLDALIAAQNALKVAEGLEPVAYAALRTADSNGKGYIARSVKVLSIALGNLWSDLWLSTGLPDNVVGVPTTQDKRFAAVGGLKAYFTNNAAKEVAQLNVTAAVGDTVYTAISNARTGVSTALKNTKTKLLARDAAKAKFQMRYRATIDELTPILGKDDPQWYDFGLNRPNDPAQPGQPANLHVTPLGSGRMLVQIDGARRANSFNYYKQVVGVDAVAVKLLNDPGTQQTFENLPVGATVIFTVTGVNDAGEGSPSDGVSGVVS